MRIVQITIDIIKLKVSESQQLIPTKLLKIQILKTSILKQNISSKENGLLSSSSLWMV